MKNRPDDRKLLQIGHNLGGNSNENNSNGPAAIRFEMPNRVQHINTVMMGIHLDLEDMVWEAIAGLFWLLTTEEVGKGTSRGARGLLFLVA